MEEERRFFENLCTPDARILKVFVYARTMEIWHKDHMEIFLRLGGVGNMGTKSWNFPWGAILTYAVHDLDGEHKILGQTYSYFDLDSESESWERFLTRIRMNTGRNIV